MEKINEKTTDEELKVSIPIFLTYKGTEIGKGVKLFDINDIFKENNLFESVYPDVTYKEILLDFISNKYTIGEIQIFSKHNLLDKFNKNIKEDTPFFKNLTVEEKQQIWFMYSIKNIFNETLTFPILSNEIIYNNSFNPHPYIYLFKNDIILTQKRCFIFPFLFPDTEIKLFPRKVEYMKQ